MKAMVLCKLAPIETRPLFSSCLKCEYCTEARENLCEDAEITGETVQGGYAEYILAREDFVTPIPDSIDCESAAPLFCLGITAYQAVKAVGPARSIIKSIQQNYISPTGF